MDRDRAFECLLLTVPDLATGYRKSFVADIFRGIPKRKVYLDWPWKDVTPLVARAIVMIDRVVYCRHFDFNLQFPDSLTYVIFGAGQEAHMTHYQVKEPDFDHVLSLDRAPCWLPEPMLECSVHLNFPDMRSAPVYCENPLLPGTYNVEYAGQPEVRPIDVGASHWFATNVVNSEDPCGASGRSEGECR